jgi:hypothetical protein
VLPLLSFIYSAIYHPSSPHTSNTTSNYFKMAPKIAIVYYSMYGHIKQMVCD